MPPKAKITRDMILSTALKITREEGFDAVNARSLAGALQCSTRPVFTCYENMQGLKCDFLEYAFEYYSRFVDDCGKAAAPAPQLVFPLSYIAFARRETNLFRLLFVSDMQLDMSEAGDFYKEIGNEKNAEAFAKMLGLDIERGREIFLNLFFYAHGIAVLTADKKLNFTDAETEKMLDGFLSAFINQTKKGD